MQVSVKKVNGFNAEMPEADETISDYLDVDKLISGIRSASFYFRSDETISDYLDVDKLISGIRSASFYFRSADDCPLARGNWTLDIEAKDGNLYCFKWPKEMKKERFVEFLQPLLVRLKRY